MANHLLAGLSAVELRALEPIDYVRLPLRAVVFEAQEPLKYLYFPASGVVSFVHADERGAMPEIAHVGCEGVLGASALFGTERARHRAIVQFAGYAYRVPVRSARHAFGQSAAFRALALRVTELLLLQLSQNVFCKLAHIVEQQFCARLLLYADRTGGTCLELTHEQMAEALGSRRQGITEVARRLQARQVIAYSRGRMSLLDRDAAERHACLCYRVVGDAYRAAEPAHAASA